MHIWVYRIGLLKLAGKLECSKKNPVLVPLFLPKIPHGLAWDPIWASTMTGSSSYIIINIYMMTDWNWSRRAVFDSMCQISSKKQQGQVHTDNNPMNCFHYSREVNLLNWIRKQLYFSNSQFLYTMWILLALNMYLSLEICTCHLDFLLVMKL